MDPAPRLAVAGVGLRFDDGSTALHDVSLAVGGGQILAVVGPSGAGKTSLLRVISGLVAATTGNVMIDGVDSTTVPPERRPVAMVFQGFALFPHLTARQNIEFGPKVRREAAIAERVNRVAERLGIADLLERRPSQLSGGERQRVALARALVRDPVVFCLDEPLASLDPVLRSEARLLLAQVVRAEGRCGVVVTHDQSEAMVLGDRIAVLHRGQLEQEGSPRDVYDRPATRFVAGFIGSPPMSLLRPPVPALGDFDGVAGVRAEHVMVVDGDDATIVAIEDLGHEAHVVLDVGGQRLVARAASVDRRVGDRVGVRVKRGAIRVFSP